jgi:hypothetical protein
MDALNVAVATMPSAGRRIAVTTWIGIAVAFTCVLDAKTALHSAASFWAY